MIEDDKKMDIIHQLMSELQDLMQPSHDDLGDRLGRPKQVEVMKMGVSSDDPDKDDDQGDSPMAMKDDMSGDMDHDMDDDDQPESPEESLKRRLLGIRG